MKTNEAFHILLGVSLQERHRLRQRHHVGDTTRVASHLQVDIAINAPVSIP